ncbi:hypothetical protein Acor_16000 [Acrocarpospora corrugata]|uniref:Uncharacterized protein n=1 Tax=Acrocarpospora corrugata TaxID=35763 RepID=A0A5M3VRX7_9ACTN|nr:hypothetical protein [Acrocarpospora corrugata]GER99536.1 hypothetical protein Acor_16000 [Acrocarpospora corrugata]
MMPRPPLSRRYWNSLVDVPRAKHNPRKNGRASNSLWRRYWTTLLGVRLQGDGRAPEPDPAPARESTEADLGTPDPLAGLALARSLARSRTFAHDLARTLEIDFDLTRVHNLARELTRSLARELALARDLARVLDINFAVDLDDARTHALDLTRARDLTRVQSRVHSLALGLESALALLNKRGIDLLMTVAKDDFRTLFLDGIDLSGVDLRGAHLSLPALTGAKWSEETMWPSHLETQLREHSREISPGLFVVAGPGDDRSSTEHLVPSD